MLSGTDKRDQPEGQITQEMVLQALSRVQEPELGRDVVSLRMIKDIKICNGTIAFTIVLTTPACPLKAQMEKDAREAVMQLPGVQQVNVHWDAQVPASRGAQGKVPVDGVKNIIAVASGKGGVGKSTVAVNLACALASLGARVGLCDCDIYGPNVPRMMGVQGRPRGRNNKIIPLEGHGVRLMSMGFLTTEDTPLIWRGPMLHGVIQQFLRQVEWGDLDYLIVDLPPGTGDAQLTLVQSVPLMGAVIVTTPQDVALEDVSKAIRMFQQVDVEILGVVENMSYFVCPHCQGRTDIFDHGGGLRTSQRYKVPFLGEIPLDPQVRIGGDSGCPITISQPDSPVAQAFLQTAEKMAARVSVANYATLSVR